MFIVSKCVLQPPYKVAGHCSEQTSSDNPTLCCLFIIIAGNGSEVRVNIHSMLSIFKVFVPPTVQIQHKILKGNDILIHYLFKMLKNQKQWSSYVIDK